MLDYTIHYIISLPDEDPTNKTIFQGFSFDLVDSVPILNKILNDLPINLLEYNYKRDYVIKMRLSGMIRFNILPLNMSDLHNMIIDFRSPFYCVFSDDNSYTKTQIFVDNSPVPILHVSTQKTSSTISLPEANLKYILKHARLVLDSIQDNLPHPLLSKSYDILDNLKPWRKKTVNLEEREHLISFPNEVLLKSLNFQFKNKNPLIASTTDDLYVNALLESLDLIANERNRVLTANKYELFHPPSTTLILYLASMFRPFYKQKIKTHNILSDLHGDVPDIKKISQVLKCLRQQKNYSFIYSSDKIKYKFKDFVNSPEFQSLMKLRSEEIRTSNYAIAVKATNNFAPCLRISPALNTIQGDIQQIADCDRANSNKRVFKINRLLGKLKKKMSNMIDEKLLDFIGKDNNSIKIISDVPLEWININDLPLMIRSNTSRVAPNPGNLFFQQVTNSIGLTITPEDLTEILVVRSFNENDPLRRLLEISISSFLDNIDFSDNLLQAYKHKPEEFQYIKELVELEPNSTELDVNVTYVDVSTEDEFIDALNNFNGLIMIFDGHGLHDRNSDIGSILLKDKKFDVWKLVAKARVPPIVLLSACDTHPIDASHASTANGFLAAGALTVLATGLPLNALYASMFIGRLLFRIKSYIPTTIYDMNRQLRWNEVVSGLQRMSYMTETLDLLNEYSNLSFDNDTRYRISFKSNMLINSDNLYWYEEILETIADELQLSTQEIKDQISKYAQFPESIKYFQMGNPEQILIVNKELLNSHKQLINDIQ